MYGLIKALYDEKGQKAFEQLYQDSEVKDQLLMRATLAEALKDCPRFLPSHGPDWILCTLASYHKPEEDTARVFQAVMRKMDKMTFGTLDEKIRWREMNEIADTCLVGIGLFRKKLEAMHRRHASPSVGYYMRTGSVAFQRLGYDNIGENFEGWVYFLEKEIGWTCV